jgi:hypothetical protein
VVVDDEVREVSDSVLHDKECTMSMLLHKNREELLWSGTSTKKGGVVASTMTWSGGTGGPMVGPIDPQAARGPGAPLGPAHEEKWVIRRDVHGGRERRKIE